jgi:hypothetical protein
MLHEFAQAIRKMCHWHLVVSGFGMQFKTNKLFDLMDIEIQAIRRCTSSSCKELNIY